MAERPPPDRPPLERMVHAAVAVPWAVGAKLVGVIPRAIGDARQRVETARLLGKVAVDRGVRELRQRITPPPDGDPSEPTTARDDPDEPPPPEAAAPPVADLALPDYDHLPAAHIVAKLEGLSDHERELIERYEAAHRRRRTVLGKLERLRPDGS